MKLLANGVETILFDKDGTLIDFPSIWLPWIEDIENHLMHKLSDYPLSPGELKRAFGFLEQKDSIDPKGPLAIASIEESITVIAFLLYQNGVPWDSAVTYARESADFADEIQNHSLALRPVEGIIELLDSLSEKGITLGVLTADNTDKAKEQLKELKLDEYFQFIIGSDLVERGKPFPDLAYVARDKYGVNLKEAIMIGDTNADIQLGKRAGVKMTIGIASYTKNETNHLNEADWIIQNYAELLVTN